MVWLLAEERQEMRTSTETSKTRSAAFDKSAARCCRKWRHAERLGLLTNDIEAIDRVLTSLGHDTETGRDAKVPRLSYYIVANCFNF